MSLSLSIPAHPITILHPPTRMKHNKNHDNRPADSHESIDSHQLVPVHFELHHPTAVRVAVAGSFNDWVPDSRALSRNGTGHWSKDTALVPGTYEYCLVVDGHWMPDPAAHESVPNPYGGRNSILHVTGLPAAGNTQPNSPRSTPRNSPTTVSPSNPQLL